jgi:hypothetical protein
MDGLGVELLGTATGGPVQAERIEDKKRAEAIPQRVPRVCISEGYLGAGLPCRRVSLEHLEFIYGR